MKITALVCAALLPLAACQDPERDEVLAELRGLRSDLSGPAPESVEGVQAALKPLAETMQVLLTEQRSLRQRQSVLTDEMTRFTEYLQRGAGAAAPQNPEELTALKERLTRLEQELATKDAEHREVEEMLRGALETTSLQLEAFLKQVETMGPPGDAPAATGGTGPGDAKGDGGAPKKGAVGAVVDQLRDDVVTQWLVIGGLVLLLWFGARLWMARRPRRDMDEPIPSQELFGHDDPTPRPPLRSSYDDQATDFDIESPPEAVAAPDPVHTVDESLYVIDAGNELEDDVPEEELDREFEDSIREVEAMRLFPIGDDDLVSDPADEHSADEHSAEDDAELLGGGSDADAAVPESGFDWDRPRPAARMPEATPADDSFESAEIIDVSEAIDLPAPEIEVRSVERPTVEGPTCERPTIEPVASEDSLRQRPALHLVPAAQDDDSVARLMVPGTDRAGAVSQLREAVAREPWVVQQPPPQVELGDGMLEATLRFLPETPVAERGRILARARRALS